ncbi:helix-turn-helix domain-containing protein [Halobaculum roseum]|uniref:Helix-turn-helix domain-containing protein n=2 Tax=Halobaculum roseum TaxID=2175149 RepID=A0ABD5MVA9_9EURY
MEKTGAIHVLGGSLVARMVVHATVAVAPREFLLGRTLAVAGDARIELECAVPLGDRFAPYLTIAADDPKTVCDLVAAEPSVDRVDPLRRGDDEWLVRVRWTGPRSPVLTALRDADAVCVEAVATRGTWHLTLRFDSHEQLTDCYHRCLDRDVRLSVDRVHEGEGLRQSASRALTSAQREALATAFDAGYFAVPREVTLAELADRLGISDTAASQRLRRGLQNLLADTLEADAPDPA